MATPDPWIGVLAWLGTYLVHSTLLLGTALGLRRLGALRTPRLAERTWRLALLGGLFTASLQLASGTEPFLGRFSLQAPSSPSIARLAAPDERAEPATELPVDAPAANAFFGSSEPARSRAPRSTSSPSGSRLGRGPLEERSAHPANRRESTRRAREARATEHAPFALAEEPATSEAPFAATRPEPATTLSVESGPGFLAALGARMPRPGWRPVVVGAWGLVGAGGLLLVLWSWSRFFWRLGDRREIVRGPLHERLQTLRRSAGLRARIRLSTSPTIESPITCGWIRREICVPARALTDLSASQQESMLAHELAHAVRRDPLWFSLYALLERVLFFQPLNRLARRELADLAELQCDDRAVRWTGGRLALASCLTEIAHWIVGNRNPALPMASMAARPSRLGRRVERLLDDRRSPTPEPRHAWWSPTACLALGTFVFCVPGVTSARPATPAAEPPPTIAEPVPFPLRVDQELLDAELLLLEEELQALRAEVGQAELDQRFAEAFARMERQLDALRERRERLEALLPEIIVRPQQPSNERIR